jgi:phosphatidylglycerophosphatase A
LARYTLTDIVNTLKGRSQPAPVPKAVWQNPWYFIAFGLGSGTIPIAPGTFGTLMAIPFYLLFQSLPTSGYIFLLLCLTAISIWILDRVSREIQVHDHPGMCLDEFIGYFVTMTAAPTGWAWVVIGFILFRLFDIFKPWPINVLDKNIHGGLGIVLDDVVAGIFAAISIQIIGKIT